eukprot:269126-Chlamydomonas_euryale.AAC.1
MQARNDMPPPLRRTQLPSRLHPQAPDQSTFEARVRMAERIHAQFSRLMGGHHASAPVLTALRLAYGCVVVHGSMVRAWAGMVCAWARMVCA